MTMPTPVGAIATESIAPTFPGQRVSQPPALRLEGRERALDLVLRASANPAATGERKPVDGVKAQPGGREEQQPAERRRSRAPGREPEQHSRDAAQPRLAGANKPAILLATRVVHAVTNLSARPRPNALSHALNSRIA